MTDKVENTEVQEETLAASSLRPASKTIADPKSKIEMITHAIGAMHAMKKDDLTKWFNDTIAQFGPGKTYGVGDNSGKNASSIDMKASAATATTGPKTKYAMPKLSVKEDVEEMFSGQDLSEEFKEKASTIFEAAVTARATIEVARLEEEFEVSLEEAVAEINEELTSKLDTYLDYVTEQWMEANEVAVESTLRNEVMEEFIDGLKTLFTEHYIEVPQDKVDVIESLAAKVEELEEKLDEQITENVEMKRAFIEVEKENVLESYVSELALSQQDKFKALAEGVDFDGDVEVYARKLSIIKDKYFTEQKTAPVDTNITEETFEGETDSADTVSYDPTVKRYADIISKTLRK
jgi:hypothetical protein